MTFEEAMQLTRTVSSPTAFEDMECRAYFETLMSLEEGALVVEVGLEYGRSSSIALQVVKNRLLRYIGIDSFPDENIYSAWQRMAAGIELKPWRCNVARNKSDFARINQPINAILIDADHEYPAVMNDCEHFLPHVVPEGFAMFHDFGRDSLPGVYKAVTDYMETRKQWVLRRISGTLGIFKRK
jgi:predicted O-methyltransferase YrrM